MERKKVGEFRGGIDAIRKVFTPSLRMLRSLPKKKMIWSCRRFTWRYRFSVVVWYCWTLNQTEDSELFTYLLHIYCHWLSDLKLRKQSEGSHMHEGGKRADSPLDWLPSALVAIGRLDHLSSLGVGGPWLITRGKEGGSWEYRAIASFLSFSLLFHSSWKGSSLWHFPWSHCCCCTLREDVLGLRTGKSDWLQKTSGTMEGPVYAQSFVCPACVWCGAGPAPVYVIRAVNAP